MTSKLQKAISFILCLFMVCGVLPNDLYTNQIKSGYAEAPSVAERGETEAPATPPTEEPTNTPKPEVTPEPTQAPAVEPSDTDASTCAPVETQPQDTLPVAEPIAPLPDHPYLRFEMQPEGLVVIGFRKQVKAIVVPAFAEGIAVVRIAERAFKGADEIETVSIEEGLLTIGKEAFKDCISLTQVDLPSTITEIAADAFDGCTALRMLHAPDDCYAYDFAAAWLMQHGNQVGEQTTIQPSQSVEPTQSAQPDITTEKDAPAVEVVETQQLADGEQANDVEQSAALAAAQSLPETDPLAALLINGNTVVGIGMNATFTATIQSSVYTARDAILWSLGGTAAATLKTSGNTATVTAKADGAAPVALTATLQKDRSITATVYLAILPLASKVTVTAETGRTMLDINTPADSVQLSAKVTPDTANQSVVWKSSNPAVASVDSNGLVTVGTKAGMAVISAAAVDGSKKSGTYAIAVSKALTGITLTGPAVVGIGKTVKPLLSCTPANATNQTVQWASSNPKVASVSATGSVKGIAAGEATITAIAKENPALKAEWLLRVAPSVTKMSIASGGIIDLSAPAPHERQLTLTIEPAATAAEIVWSSSKPSVATVDANGLVSAAGASGATTIKASATDGSGKSATVNVTAAYLPTAVQISGSATVVAGRSTALRASVAPAAASQAVTWVCDNKNVATVDAKGVVKANVKAAAGTSFTITATSVDGKTSSNPFTMTIAAPVDDFTIEGAETLDMATEMTLALTAETKDGHTPAPVLWTSNNPKVATVDAFGTVTPLSAGIAIITATATDGSGKKATKRIQIISCVESIRSASSPSLTLALGKTVKLDAAAMPATALAADRVLGWQSSDPATVSVSAGTLKALKITPADTPVTVTVTAAGQSADGAPVSHTFSVTVLPMTTKVTITPEPNQNYINLSSRQTTLQLSAVVLPATACQTVQWQSSNDAVATVDESGLVTGLAAGKVTITATTQDASLQKASLNLTVFGGAESIAITGAERICGGLSAAYTAAVTPQAANQAVVWSIQADTVPVTIGGKVKQQPVASITAAGVVKTIAVPEKKQAMITARSKDDTSISSTFALAVLPASTSVTINAARSMVSTNPVSALQMTATVAPAEAAQAVTWRSSDAAVATVSESGLVTGKSKGYVIITATAADGSNASAHKWIGVGESVQALEIIGPSDMGTGTQADLSVAITPSEAAIPDVTWKSSNESVATIDAQGHVVVAGSIANSPETVEFTATSVENPDVSDTLAVSVHLAVTGITLTPKTTQYIDFTTGEGRLQLSASVDPEGALERVAWSSSDETVATVDDAGLVTAHQVGSTIIMAWSQDQYDVSASIEVRVGVDNAEHNFSYSVIDYGSGKEIRIDSYIGDSPVVNVPANILGYPVTEIGEWAFYLCQGLTGITLPECIQRIGDGAFHGCSSLTTCALPNSVSNLGYGTFGGCYSLSSITLPDSLSRIENSTFEGCSSLSNITLPDCVTSLGASAFKGCSSLSNITIPEGVSIIEESLFMGCSSLSSIVLPDSISSIGDSAFNGCNKLFDITMPERLTNIGSWAFNQCSDLRNIVLSNGLRSIGQSAFANCIGLVNIVLPDGITSIENYSFYNCVRLISIVLPEELKGIGGWAFYGCTDLTCITLPYRVSSIGSYAFYGCTSLSTITLSDSLISIGDWALSRCVSLTSIALPDSLSTIYDAAFCGCTNLENVTFSDSLTIIGNETFSGCISLDNISLPLGLTRIGNGVFGGCSSLVNITFPASVTSIGSNAFAGCSSITNIILPDVITSIGAGAFEYCNCLTSITLPDGVTSLLDDVFAYVPLSDIWIGENTTSISPRTFWANDISTLTIHGIVGSYAESYADLYGYSFSSVLNNLSGTVVTSTFERLSGVTVTIYRDQALNQILSQLTTDANGMWNWKDPRILNQVYVAYTSPGYQFCDNGERLETEYGVTAALYTIGTPAHTPVAPSVLGFTASDLSPATGDTVTFTVQTQGADSVVLVVDGVAYETYYVVNNLARVTREFSVGGNRSIQFIPRNGDISGSISEAMALNIATNGQLEQTVISCAAELTLGFDLAVSWSAVPHADYYVVRCKYNDGLVWISGHVTDCGVDIPGTSLSEAGSYQIMVSACGKGYTQSDSTFTLSSQVMQVTFGLSTPQANDAFICLDSVYINVTNPDGYYTAVRITKEDGSIQYLPTDGALRDTAPIHVFKPELSGQYTLEVVGYTTANRTGEWGKSAARTINVNDGQIRQCKVGAGYGNMRTTDAVTVQAVTNNAISSVDVSLDNTYLLTMSTYTEDASTNRTFSSSVPACTEGMHVYTFQSTDTNGNVATRKFTFYAYTAITTSQAYPVDGGALLKQYPTLADSEGTTITPAQAVQIMGAYGSMYYVKANAKYGYILQSRLQSQPAESAMTKALCMVETVGPTARFWIQSNTKFNLQWLLNIDMPVGAIFLVRLTGVANPMQNYTIYQGAKTNVSLDLPSMVYGDYTLTVMLADAVGGMVHTSVQSEITYGFYANYADFIANGEGSDSLHRLIQSAREVINSQTKLHSIVNDSIQAYVDNGAMQTYSWMFGDELDATQCDLIRAAYLADAIMYSLSMKANTTLILDLKDIRTALEAIGIPSVVMNLLTDAWFDDVCKQANIVTIASSDGSMFLITTDRSAIKKILDKLKVYFRIDTSVLDTISDTAKIADILFAVFKDYQVYSNVPQYKLQAVIKSLRLAQVNKETVLSITADLLEKYAEGDSNILTFLLAGYASEYVLDKLIDGAKDAYGALLAGHLFLGAKIGEAFVKPLVEGSLNTSEVNAAAYRAVWACDAADDYLSSYTATVVRFSTNPIKYYDEMVKSSGTMCRLLSNTVSAVYTFEQSTHDGLWSKFYDWLSGEDIDAKTKSNEANVGLWSNYLKFDCDSFYENVLRPLRVAKVEWP